jgi:glycosyltransferase involved in cell wall biosynthesis
VTDGVTGLLVPARNSVALAAAIAQLHDNPALRLRLGAAARARAVSEFDERSVITRTLGVYRELIPEFREVKVDHTIGITPSEDGGIAGG